MDTPTPYTRRSLEHTSLLVRISGPPVPGLNLIKRLWVSQRLERYDSGCQTMVLLNVTPLDKCLLCFCPKIPDRTLGVGTCLPFYVRVTTCYSGAFVTERTLTVVPYHTRRMSGLFTCHRGRRSTTPWATSRRRLPLHPKIGVVEISRTEVTR